MKVIKVGASHHGNLKPGMMLVIDDADLHSRSGASFFENPMGGGFTPCEVIDPDSLGIIRRRKVVAKNDRVCPETPMRVLLRADEIPDRAEVCKRTGEQTFTLVRDLKIYGALHEHPEVTTADRKEQHMIVQGFFLLGPRGSINQITPGKMLHWCTTAEELVDELRRSWEEEAMQ